LGTAAVTTLGMGDAEMKEIASIIKSVLSAVTALPDKQDTAKKSLAKYAIDVQIAEDAEHRVKDLLARYPLYPELEIE
jgi:glycine hydroxymethyltransferase